MLHHQTDMLQLLAHNNPDLLSHHHDPLFLHRHKLLHTSPDRYLRTRMLPRKRNSRLRHKVRMHECHQRHLKRHLKHLRHQQLQPHQPKVRLSRFLAQALRNRKPDHPNLNLKPVSTFLSLPHRVSTDLSPAPDYDKLIPPPALPIYTILKAEFSRVAPLAPPTFKKHVIDLDRRLTMLYDHLAKGDLINQDTILQLLELAQALQARNYERAQALQTDVHREKMEECGQWMAGVKRLIAMSRATP